MRQEINEIRYPIPGLDIFSKYGFKYESGVNDIISVILDKPVKFFDKSKLYALCWKCNNYNELNYFYDPIMVLRKINNESSNSGQ